MRFLKYETTSWEKLTLLAVGVTCVAVVAFGLYVRAKESQPQPTAPGYLASSAQADMAETTVYVTRAGLWYHRGSCRELQKSRIPVKLSQVQQYCRPCSKCRPPRQETRGIGG